MPSRKIGGQIFGMCFLVILAFGVLAQEVPTQRPVKADKRIANHNKLAEAQRKNGNVKAYLFFDSLAFNLAAAGNNVKVKEGAFNTYAEDLFRNNMIDDAEKAIKLFEKSIGNAECASCRYYLYRAKGMYYFKVMNRTLAMENYKLALSHVKNFPDSAKFYNLTHQVARTETLLNPANSSVTNTLFACLAYFKKKNDFASMVECFQDIAFKFETSGQYVKAMEYYNLALENARKTNNNSAVASVHAKIAFLKINNKRFSEAYGHLKEAKRRFNQHPTMSSQLLMSLYTGLYHYHTGSYVEAEKLFIQAKQINAASAKSALINMQIGALLSQVYVAQKKQSLADSTLKAVLANDGKNLPKDLLGFATEKLSVGNKQVPREDLNNIFLNDKKVDEVTADKVDLNIYTAINPKYNEIVSFVYDSLLLNVETKYRTKIISDSLVAQQQMLLIANLVLLRKDDSLKIRDFQKQSDDKTIRLKTDSILLGAQNLKIEQQKQLISAQQANTFKYVSIAFAALFLISLAVARLFLKLKRKADDLQVIAEKERVIAEQSSKEALELSQYNMVLRSAGNHIMSNGLQKMNIYVADYKYADGDKEAVKTFQLKMKSIANLFKSMTLGVNESEIDLQNTIAELVENMKELYETGSVVNYEVDAPVVFIHHNDDADIKVQNLNSILIELIQNSIKHAFKDTAQPIIRILMERKGDRIRLHYADNGSGIPLDNQRYSGLSAIWGSSDSLLGEYTQYNEAGFNFKLEFPN